MGKVEATAVFGLMPKKSAGKNTVVVGAAAVDAAVVVVGAGHGVADEGNGDDVARGGRGTDVLLWLVVDTGNSGVEDDAGTRFGPRKSSVKVRTSLMRIAL